MLMESQKITKKEYASVRLHAKTLYGYLHQALINNEEHVSINCSAVSSEAARAPSFSGNGVAVWVEESKYD